MADTTTARNVVIDGRLHLQLCVKELIEDATPAELREWIDLLACSEKVLEEVAAQIADGVTSLDSSGLRDYPVTAEPQRPLEKAIRRVAKAAGTVASEQIERLERALAEKEQTEKWYRETIERHEGLIVMLNGELRELRELRSRR